MATVTDSGDTREDERVARLAAKPLDSLPQGSGLTDEERDKFDDIAKGYNNDESSNATNNSGGSSGSSGSSGSAKSSSSTSAKSSTSGGTGVATGKQSGSSASAKPGSTVGAGAGRLANFGNNSKRKKKPLMYAVFSIIFAGILAGGFASILPLKLESMMKNIIKKRIESRLEHYFLKRMLDKDLLKQYFKASLGATDEEFEAAIKDLDPATKDLLRTWRAAKLEDSLKKGQRITITKDAKGNINVAKDGKAIGTIDDPEALDVVTEGFIEDSKVIQFFYRGPMRWMWSELYGMAKSRFFSGEDDEQQANEEVTTELVDDATPGVIDSDQAVLTCALAEGSCPTDESNIDPNQRIGTVDTQASQTGGDGDSTVEAAATEAETTATSNFKARLSAITDNFKYLQPSYYISKLITKYISTEAGEAVSKFFDAAAGPLLIIAAVDIASRIDHFFWYGSADKVLINVHKIQYAAQFAEWSTISDQWASGQNVSGAEFNAVNTMLDGTEKSAASESIYGTGTGGQGLDTLNDGTGDTMTRSIDEQDTPIENFYKQWILPTIGFTMGISTPPGAPLAVANLNPVHYMLLAWYDTAGKIWGAINDVLGFLVNGIIKGLEAVIPWLKDWFGWITMHIGELLGKLIGFLIQPAVDGTEVGADLMNGIDAGGAVVGMDFARQMGGHLLTASQGSALDTEIAQEDQTQASQMSLADRLFNTNYASSGINLLALRLPSTPDGLVGDGMGYVASIIMQPYEAFLPGLKSILVGNASAANDTPESNYGLNDWGFTDTDMAQDDTAELNQAYANATQRLGHQATLDELQLSDCPEPADPDHTADMCRWDVAMDRSASAAYDSNDDGGLNSPW